MIDDGKVGDLGRRMKALLNQEKLAVNDSEPKKIEDVYIRQDKRAVSDASVLTHALGPRSDKYRRRDGRCREH
jgi:hypothetical protein